MELEGLKRGLKELCDMGVAVQTLTTDRHIQVDSHMRSHHPDIVHMFDPWHIAKGKIDLFTPDKLLLFLLSHILM